MFFKYIVGAPGSALILVLDIISGQMNEIRDISNDLAWSCNKHLQNKQDYTIKIDKEKKLQRNNSFINNNKTFNYNM